MKPYEVLLACCITLTSAAALEGTLFPSSPGRCSLGQVKALHAGLPSGKYAPLLAFAELYAGTREAELALNEVCQLFMRSGGAVDGGIARLRQTAPALIAFSELEPVYGSLSPSEEAALELLEAAGSHLPHRRLRGHCLRAASEIAALSHEEIDVARALLLSELGDDPLALKRVCRYEAILDLLALELLSTLGPQASGDAKVAALNTLIFETLGFRFPRTSRYVGHIDAYTCLHAVLDTRQGVCLGVTLLYLCLAQRLGLDLDIVTPPGHIFLRYRGDGPARNIETTAGGVHIDDSEYLGVSLRSLPTSDCKKVLGLAHMNQASTFLLGDDYAAALAEYERAARYLGDSDPIISELMAICHLSLDSPAAADTLLRRAIAHPSPHQLTPSTIPADLLDSAVDAAGIRLLYTPLPTQRADLDAYRLDIEALLARYPRFRAGWLQLAHAWLELDRHGHALAALERYYLLDDSDPHVTHLLAQLSLERYDYQKAWLYFHRTQELCTQLGCQPKALRELRSALLQN